MQVLGINESARLVRALNRERIPCRRIVVNQIVGEHMGDRWGWGARHTKACGERQGGWREAENLHQAIWRQANRSHCAAGMQRSAVVARGRRAGAGGAASAESPTLLQPS